jgi:hypothetical protein
MRLPDVISVDGKKSNDGLVEYWGVATRQPNGKYHCYANIGGVLAIVEVVITPLGANHGEVCSQDLLGPQTP